MSIYRTGERIGQMQEDAGMERSCNGWIGLVLSFFLWLYALYYQYELNRIWARLGNPEEGSLVALPVGAAAPASRPDGVPDGAPRRRAGRRRGRAPGWRPRPEQPQAARSGGAPGLRPRRVQQERPGGRQLPGT